MTTAAEVKKLAKLLLDTHPNLALSGRTIVVRPVTHVLRGIFIDRTRSKEFFSVYCLLDLLFRTDFGPNLGIGPELYRKNGRWDLTSQGIEKDLVKIFNIEALPLLEQASSLRAYEDYVLETKRDAAIVAGSVSAAELKVALGELEVAASLAERFIKNFEARIERLEPFELNYLKAAKELYALILRGDRRALAEHLHANEKRNVERLKIAHLHERTPFPLELM